LQIPSSAFFSQAIGLALVVHFEIFDKDCNQYLHDQAMYVANFSMGRRCAITDGLSQVA
jgi:hypothetical protein